MIPAIQVIVLGPKGSGKTTLILDMIDAVTHGGHGYSKRVGLKLKSKTGSPDTIEQLKREPEHRDELLAERKDTLRSTGPAATPRDDIPSRELVLEYQSGRSSHSRRITVTDAAGDHFFPIADDNSTEPIEPLPKLDDQLMDALAAAEGVVIVASCLQVASTGFANQLTYVLDVFAKRHQSKLIDHADGARVSSFERIVIAVSKIDFAFMPFGRYSSMLASNQQVARMVLSDLLNAPEVRAAYESIMRHAKDRGGPFDIKLVPTSAFGFDLVGGQANVDPRSAPPSRVNATDPSTFPVKVVADALLVCEDESETEASQDTFVRFPFLTADPMIYAATGLTGQFHFDLGDLLGLEIMANARIDPTAKDGPAKPSPDEPNAAQRFLEGLQNRVRNKIRELQNMQDDY